MILPRLDGEGTIEFALEFSGLPNQCGRCRSREHQVKYYPRREFTNRFRPTQRVPHRRLEPPNRSDTHNSPQPTLDLPLNDTPDTPTENLDRQEIATPQQTPQGTQQSTPIVHLISTPDTPKENTTIQDNPRPKPTPQKVSEPTKQTPPNTGDIIDSRAGHTQSVREKEIDEAPNNKTLQPDYLNFPKLPSSAQKIDQREEHQTQQQQTNHLEAKQFVWRKLQMPEMQEQGAIRAGGEKGKGKQVSRTLDSAPITRQGYRSGKLAEDFWVALATPHTPTSMRKTL